MKTIITSLLLYIQIQWQLINYLMVLVVGKNINLNDKIKTPPVNQIYAQMQIDSFPKLETIELLDYKKLLAEHLHQSGKELKPVRRHKNTKNKVPNTINCPYCGAPHIYLYDNNGGKTAMAFYEEFPHPAELKYYGKTRLKDFLNDQVKSIGNDKAATILYLVDKDKKKTADAEARNTIIIGIIKQLRLLSKSLEKINNQLEKTIKESQYKLTTMPGIDFKLARYAGLAPVEHSSGTSKSMGYKKYGCRDLNHVFYLLAFQQIGDTKNGKIKNPASYKYYQKMLREGKSQKVALTCLEKRLVDIIYSMMRNRFVSDYQKILIMKCLIKLAKLSF